MDTNPRDRSDGAGPLPNGRDQQAIDLRTAPAEFGATLEVGGDADAWARGGAASGTSATPSVSLARLPTTDEPTAATVQDGRAEVPARPALAARTVGAAQHQDNRSLQLITRFAAGAVILGLEELVRLGDKWEAAATPESLAAPNAEDEQEDTAAAVIRYWLLGLIASGRRRAWDTALDALEASGSVVGAISRNTERAMDVWLFRPIRRPVMSVVNGVLHRAASSSRSWIAEGRQEERISRWIAANGVAEIIDLVIDAVARSPEIDGVIDTVARSPEIDSIIDAVARSPEVSAMVRSQLTQQSVGIASTVVDTSRRIGSVGDDMTEEIVRRLLRRRPPTGLTPIVPVDEPASAEPGKPVP